MPNSRKADLPDPAGDNRAHIKRLIDAVETVADQLQVLRVVLDEIREEFVWALRNPEHFHAPTPICRVTSMPSDPCAKDWGERLNRFTPQDLPPEQSPPPAPPLASAPSPPQRGLLFDLDDGA